MAALRNPRWEQFCRFTAMGQRRGEAYANAGYEPKDAKRASQLGSLLFRKPEIKARVTEVEEELREASLSDAMIDRTFILKGLKDNHDKASKAVAVLDRTGRPTGEYRYDGGVANRSLELMGKELGMFADRVIFDDLDKELADMTGKDLRVFVRSCASEVGLRVVEMNDEETRAWIRRNAARVGLRIEDCGEDPEGAVDQEDRTVQPVSETSRVPRSRLN
jgi:hypothetical protein